MAKRRQSGVRWWHLAIIAFALFLSTLIAAGYAIRADGRSQYQSAVAHLKTIGKPASIDDYIASAPPVDVALQNDWDTWQKSFITGVSGARFDLAGTVAKYELEWDFWVTGRGPRPREVEDALATNAAQHAPAIRMLRHGGLVLSGFGWMVQDLPPGKRRLPFTSTLRISQLLAARELALWLRYSTVLADDPREHLADLDSLHSAMKRPATMIDAMIAIAVANIRDRTYGDLMLQERLADDFKVRWLAETSRSLALVADGFEGESVLMGMGTAAMIDVTSIAEVYPGWSHWRNLPTGLSMWLNGSADCAIMVDLETHAAQRLRGERPDVWPAWHIIKPRVGALGRIVIPNLLESAITALEADAHHRIMRLAVHILAQSRVHGLPTDEADLCQKFNNPMLLTPSGDHLHLRYERLGDNRFRLVVSPTSPVSNFDDPKRMAQRSKAFGQPPSKESKITQTRIQLEIPLPAHLLPPKP